LTLSQSAKHYLRVLSSLIGKNLFVSNKFVNKQILEPELIEN